MKLSIVIPTYNSFDKTKKLIDSLENQDLSDVEVIVVNDGSLKKYGEFPEFVNYISLKNNGGAVNARMQGWLQSSGDFIWFFDGDDEITKGSIQRIISSLTIHDLNVYKMVKEKRNKKRYEFPIKIKDRNSIAYSSYFGDKIFKSEVIQKNMFDLKSEIFQDENFILRFGNKATTVKIYKNIEPISCYLYNFGSISKNETTPKQVMKLVNNVNSLISFVESLPKDKYKKKAKQQMTRMIVIAKGWSLKLKRKDRKLVLKKIKKIKKENKKEFGFLANYSTANFFINIVSKIKY